MSTVDDVRVKPIPIIFEEPTEIEGGDGKKIKVVNRKERNLFFDFNALIELEKKYGSVSAAMSGIKDLKIENMRDMIWAGLLHEDETLTPKQVGKWLNMGNVEYIAETIMEAMGVQMPKPEGEPQSGE